MQSSARSLESGFKYALAHDLLDKSPAEHLKAFAQGRGQDARDAFTDEQLVAYFGLLKDERETNPADYWVPRVMAYTGLRLEEAAALRKCDVREIDRVWCVEVSPEASDIKTDNAAGFVPIHSAVLEQLKVYVWTCEGAHDVNLWRLEQDSRRK